MEVSSTVQEVKGAMSVNLIALLLLAHFVGDFILQSDWMAGNKTTSWKAMGSHIGLYTLCLVPFGLVFALVNGLAHFATDSITARMTKALYAKGERHWFFVVIGADQLIHYATMFYSYGYFNLTL
jgi:hypothetical protein